MGGAGGRGSPPARGAARRRTSAHSGGGDAGGSHQLVAAVRRAPAMDADRQAWLAAHPYLGPIARFQRSEEHTSELQSRLHLVCRLLLEKKTFQSLRTNGEGIDNVKKFPFMLSPSE